MTEYRRKPKIIDKIRIGHGTPLQQYIFRSSLLNDWINPISVISQVKVFSFKGKSHKASNADIHRALEQLVNIGALDKR